MATTWPVRSVGVAVMGHPQLSYVAQWEPEGLSQTFTAGSPVVQASGLLVASTDPVDLDDTNYVTGVAIEDGHNAAVGRATNCKFLPAIDGIIFYANLLTGNGATNAFAVGDLFDEGGCDLSSKSGVVTSGVTDWFLDDAGTNGCTIVSTRADMVVVNKSEPEGSRVLAADSDVRVGFMFIPQVVQYNYLLIDTDVS